MPTNVTIGVVQAFVCLAILAAMPVVANSRPDAFQALSFAFSLSVWQTLFAALPLAPRLARARSTPHAAKPAKPNRRARAIILATSALFGLSTYLYVLTVEKAGAVSAAIAFQAYPLFAIILEIVFLKRGKSTLQLFFTLLLVAAMAFLATKGALTIDNLSIWFVAALSVPLIWSVAHIVVKETLNRTRISPVEITFARVAVSTLFLGLALALATPGAFADLANAGFQKYAAAMGLIYTLELVVWFYAIRHIDVSLASSITTPAPAGTMLLAVVFLGENVTAPQIAGLLVVVVSVYGLLCAGALKARRELGAGRRA